jgi:hypothetical protein
MKRSERVPATLIAALAASLSVSGCGGYRTYRECVDATGLRVPDSHCHSGHAGSHWVTRRVSTGGFGGRGFSGGGYGFGG